MGRFNRRRNRCSSHLTFLSPWPWAALQRGQAATTVRLRRWLQLQPLPRLDCRLQALQAAALVVAARHLGCSQLVQLPWQLVVTRSQQRPFTVVLGLPAGLQRLVQRGAAPELLFCVVSVLAARLQRQCLRLRTGALEHRAALPTCHLRAFSAHPHKLLVLLGSRL